jgi:hypothetical protein
VTRAEFFHAAARYSLAAVGIVAIPPKIARAEINPAPQRLPRLDYVVETMDGKELLVREDPNFPWTFCSHAQFGVHAVTVSACLTPRARRRALRQAVRAARRREGFALGRCIRHLNT